MPGRGPRSWAEQTTLKCHRKPHRGPRGPCRSAFHKQGGASLVVTSFNNLIVTQFGDKLLLQNRQDKTARHRAGGARGRLATADTPGGLLPVPTARGFFPHRAFCSEKTTPPLTDACTPLKQRGAPAESRRPLPAPRPLWPGRPRPLTRGVLSPAG